MFKLSNVYQIMSRLVSLTSLFEPASLSFQCAECQKNCSQLANLMRHTAHCWHGRIKVTCRPDHARERGGAEQEREGRWCGNLTGWLLSISSYHLQSLNDLPTLIPLSFNSVTLFFNAIKEHVVVESWARVLIFILVSKLDPHSRS